MVEEGYKIRQLYGEAANVVALPLCVCVFESLLVCVCVEQVLGSRQIFLFTLVSLSRWLSGSHSLSLSSGLLCLPPFLSLSLSQPTRYSPWFAFSQSENKKKIIS